MTEPTTQKRASPVKRTPEIDAEIIRRLSKGEPLAQICRTPGFPDPATIWKWREGDEALEQSIARARLLGFDAIADEAFEIADTGNPEDVQRAKLRIETRLKLLAKWDPKRYGERIATEHTGANGGPIKVLKISGEESEL